MRHAKMGEAPVFVKIEEYKDIVDVLDMIRDKLNEAKKILGDINGMKQEEDSEIQAWHTTVQELERKVAEIDRSLFEHESA